MTGIAQPTSFWVRLRPPEQAAFTKVGRSRDFSKGATLMRAGESGGWAAILQAGAVRVVSADRTKRIASRRVGDVIGEQALIERAPRSATVLADTAVQALVFDGRELDQVLRDHPRVMYVLCAVMSSRLRESDQRLLADDAVARVLPALLRLVAESGAAAGEARIRIVSQEKLADQFGVSKASMDRALQALRADGLVETQRKLLVVPDIEALRRRGR